MAYALRSAAKPVAQKKFYRPRNHASSPFFKVVQQYYREFEQVYPERFQQKYGYWRPVIGTSIEKFVKCGDPKQGFARVRCPDCKEEFFVAFSCRQRGCCPSCDQKRALMLGHRLQEEVFAQVPHRQWVFTIPKRLRLFFRYDRSLLGKLCRAAYETVREVYAKEVDGDCGMPAMVGAVQTFGDLVHWHPHVHAIVADGVFTDSGYFVHIPETSLFCAHNIFQEKVFGLLVEAQRIDLATAASMRAWRHSGFNVHNKVRIEAGDTKGMQGLVEYIARCPFSLGRMVSLTKDGKILYRASKANCIPFPAAGDPNLSKGMPRNYEIYEPLEFLANVAQHIQNKGEHQIRYYGWYSNKQRGMRKAGTVKATCTTQPDECWHHLEPDTAYRRKCRMTWAALIKSVYEVDPLECPKCGGQMKVIAFIEEDDVIEKILRHCRKWQDTSCRPPPLLTVQPPLAEAESHLDYSFFEQNCL